MRRVRRRWIRRWCRSRAPTPDIFVNIATPKFAAQAIKKVGELGWHPVQFVTNVSASVGSVMKPAGYDNAQDVLSAAYLKDPQDKTWKDDPAMNEWRAFMAKWYPEGDQADASTTFGYAVARGLEQVLKQCGDNLTREKRHEAGRQPELRTRRFPAGHQDQDQPRPTLPRSSNCR